MRIALLVLATFSTAALGAPAGPMGKFEEKPPKESYVSKTALAEIERCLIDAPGYLAPMVYRQPDRPGNVTLLWTSAGVAVARVDLHEVDGGTQVRSWLWGEAIGLCAPPR